MTAEIFAPGIISTDRSEINSVFAPDRDEFYFTAWTKETGAKIMVTSQIDGRWTAPEVASFSEDYSNVDLAISYDGKRVFFGTRRPRPGETEIIEEDSPLGQSVDERGSDMRVSISSEAVCADRVERDHEHVEAAVARRHEFLPIAPKRSNDCDDCERQAEQLLRREEWIKDRSCHC